MKTERRNQFVDAVCKLVDATIAAQCEVPGPGNDALVREMHTVDCAPRNVIVPLLSVLAVPVVRPEPSRNVRVPFESVVTVPVMRPLASRKVVEVCADAAVTMTNISPIMQNILMVSPHC